MGNDFYLGGPMLGASKPTDDYGEDSPITGGSSENFNTAFHGNQIRLPDGTVINTDGKGNLNI